MSRFDEDGSRDFFIFPDKEIDFLFSVVSELSKMEPDALSRVLSYLVDRFKSGSNCYYIDLDESK